MKAYKLLAKRTAAVIEVSKPALRPKYLLIKVACVALNPTDWKTIQQTNFSGLSLAVGCDFAGTIEEVGTELTRPFDVGDRVFGFTHSCHTSEPEDGAFAEYIVVKGDVTLKIPDYMRFEEATSLGLQVYTVGQGLYQSLQLPWPTEPVKAENKLSILIYGGSTAMGSLAIQMGKLSGLEVITTCSPANFDFVTLLGADKVFDYRSPTVGPDIRQHTHNKLQYVWDTIGEGSAPRICADALSSSASFPLHYSTIILNTFPRTGVKTDITLGYTIFGDAFDMFRSFQIEAMPQNFEFTKKWGVTIEKLLEENRVVPHPVEVRSDIEGI